MVYHYINGILKKKKSESGALAFFKSHSNARTWMNETDIDLNAHDVTQGNV